VKHSAVVLAGSRPGRDEFAHQFGTDMKALVAVAGEPMVRRPVRALLASKHVGEVMVLSQSPERIQAVMAKDARIVFSRSRGTIAETMLELLEDGETQWPLLVTTADHALLDAATVDEFVRHAAGADIAVGVVERANLLDRLPGTERTWLRFRGGAYTGANLCVLRSPAVRAAIELWRSVEQDRKKVGRVIALLGPLTMLAVMLRLVTIEQVLNALGRRLGLKLRAVVLSNPLAGVDVDKPADHTLVEAILAGKA
jgi:GTP:adenosylcobinamide-phosphate guanylyltransferase